MTIVSWNSKFGYDANKQDKLREHCPGADVYVILECKKADFDELKNDWKYKNWYSDDLNDEKSQLGVAVFSDACEIEFTSQFNRMYRYIIPYRVTKGQESIILFAVWTKKIPYDYDKNVIKAVSCDEYAPLLSAKAVVIGDYNSGANKFHKDRYSALASKMNKSGLFNAVNDAGKESCFTFYGKYHENEDKNWFTNDFCFVTKDLLPECRVEILNEWDNNNMWQGLSDHCPIRVEIGFAK